MSEIRNILSMLTENEKEVKPHLPESNPGETSDWLKNNNRFAGHSEQTLDSMIDGWEVETLPEFLEDEGVKVPSAEDVEENISDNKPDSIDSEMDAYFGSKPGELEEDKLDEYKWIPAGVSNIPQELHRIYQCDECFGDGTVFDDTENAEVITCPDCLGTGHVDEHGNAVRIGFGPREDEVITGASNELDTKENGKQPEEVSMESFDPRGEPTRYDAAIEVYDNGGESELAEHLGMSDEELDAEINEWCAFHGKHADDDRQEAIEGVIAELLSNADDYMHGDIASSIDDEELEVALPITELSDMRKLSGVKPPADEVFAEEVKYKDSTQADLDSRIASAGKRPHRKDKRSHNKSDEGEWARELRHIRQLGGQTGKKVDDYDSEEVDEAIDAQTRTIKDKELTNYLDRILKKEKGKTDKYKLPYVHRSNVKNYVPIVDPEGKKFDLDRLAKDITQRPTKLLKQNEKVQHSGGTRIGDTDIFYNIGLPALTGLAYNEEDNEFVIINTCPGAGECKTFCYALKGGYVQWAPVSLSQTRILNFLYNDPSGFFDQLNAEIDEQKRKGDAKQGGHKVVIRWHDAGDFFSEEYLDLAYKLAATHPTVDFYAYTKMGDVSGATQNRPPNFLINFSLGARKAEQKRVDFGIEKHSVVVPPVLFSDLLLKDGNKIVKGPDGRTKWQWNSPEDYEIFKERMAAKYSIKPESIITYDEMMKIPMGGGGVGSGVADGDRSFKRGIYNVIVAPGDGDDSANRADVLGTYLLQH